MKEFPIVLSIAGSDPSGGAGIQADIKAISACGGYAAAAVTAVTVQNTQGVSSVEYLSGELVAAQVDAVMSDLAVDAVKIGMTGTFLKTEVGACRDNESATGSVYCKPFCILAQTDAPMCLIYGSSSLVPSP